MHGHVVVSDPSKRPHDGDSIVKLLAVDSYEMLRLLQVDDALKDAQWSEQDLADVVLRIERELEALCVDAVARILHQHRKKAFEPWMEPQLERDLAENGRAVAARSLLPLAREAKRRGLVLWFQAD